MAAEEKTLGTHELAEFFRIVEDWRSQWKIGERALYRGHADFNWILMAKLFRDPDAKPENSKGDEANEIEEQLRGEHLEMTEAHDIWKSACKRDPPRRRIWTHLRHTIHHCTKRSRRS